MTTEKKNQHIPMCDCKSSQVKGYGYDAASRTLAVQFNGGGTYHYSGVSPDLYEKMKEAESVGSYLHNNIKGKHKFTKQGD